MATSLRLAGLLMAVVFYAPVHRVAFADNGPLTVVIEYEGSALADLAAALSAEIRLIEAHEVTVRRCDRQHSDRPSIERCAIEVGVTPMGILLRPGRATIVVDGRQFESRFRASGGIEVRLAEAFHALALGVRSDSPESLVLPAVDGVSIVEATEPISEPPTRCRPQPRQGLSVRFRSGVSASLLSDVAGQLMFGGSVRLPIDGSECLPSSHALEVGLFGTSDVFAASRLRPTQGDIELSHYRLGGDVGWVYVLGGWGAPTPMAQVDFRLGLRLVAMALVASGLPAPGFEGRRVMSWLFLPSIVSGFELRLWGTLGVFFEIEGGVYTQRVNVVVDGQSATNLGLVFAAMGGGLSVRF